MAYSTAASSAACATPTAHAAIPSRPASSADSAMEKPWPSAPSSRSAGTRAPSSSTCAVTDPRMPIFFSGLPKPRPGVPFSASRALIPLAPSSEVRTIRV